FTSALFFAAAAIMATAAPIDPEVATSTVSAVVTPTATATELPIRTVTKPVVKPVVKPVSDGANIADQLMKGNEKPIKAVNAFSSSITHRGKATWFTHGYGACNISWNGNVEPVVALNSHQMGSASWGNPVCNRKVRVINKDDRSKSVIARVVDKCPGNECAWGSLDLSPAAFKKLGHLDTGILNIEWHWV
ncbi:hypothetical protein BGW38_005942, partial [Lunasporangiospora selenospora]